MRSAVSLAWQAPRETNRYSPVRNRLAFGLEIVKEEMATRLVGVGISMHSVDGLLGANHVVIEVKADRVNFVFGQILAVVERSDQTVPVMRESVTVQLVSPT